MEGLENQTPIATDAIAAGSLQTPAFIGPGEVSTSVSISTHGLAQPRLTVYLAPSEPGPDPHETSSLYLYELEQSQRGPMRFSVTVRRSGSGEEPLRIFRWQLFGSGTPAPRT